jgi:hypothetical protein
MAMNFLQDKRGTPHVASVDYDPKTDTYSWEGPTSGKRETMKGADFNDQILAPYLKAQAPAAPAPGAETQPETTPAPAQPARPVQTPSTAGPFQAPRAEPISVQSLYQAAPVTGWREAAAVVNFVDPHLLYAGAKDRVIYFETNDTYIYTDPANKTQQMPRAQFNQQFWAPYQTSIALQKAWDNLSPARKSQLGPAQREWIKKIGALTGDA